MTPRELDRLLAAASTVPPPPPGGFAQRVLAGIRRGWDPERIEWQRWVRRWWPWAALCVLIATVTVSVLPHGGHAEPEPPALRLFQPPAPELATPSAP